MTIEMKDLKFRLAGLDDLPELARLYLDFFTELRGAQGWRLHDFDEYVNDVKEYLSRGDTFILAEVEGEPIGFVRIGERDGVYWIEEVYIKPDYRGKGYGKELVKFAEDEIRKHEISAYVMVLPQDRKALSFWLKMGYTLLNSIELAKDFKPTKRSENTRVIELLGTPLKLARWENESYSETELEYLEALKKFFENGGNKELYLKIVKEALEEWLDSKSK